MPRHASTKYRVRDLSIIVSASALTAPLHHRLPKSSFFIFMSYLGTDPSPVENPNNHERILPHYGKLLKVDSRRILGKLFDL
jgi:hypothetical protein